MLKPCLDFARHPVWQQHRYRAIVHHSHWIEVKSNHAMCLNCGAWTTGASRLLAMPCEPQCITVARSRGIHRFKKGMHPGKPRSLASAAYSMEQEVEVAIGIVEAPLPPTKRVSRAIELVPILAKKQKK